MMTVSHCAVSAGAIFGRRARVDGRRRLFWRVAAPVVLLLMNGVAGGGGDGFARAQTTAPAMHVSDTPPCTATQAETHKTPDSTDLSGTWEIHEEHRMYLATLDAQGNGSYTYQGGSFTTTDVTGDIWSGTWRQTGNDREGGFEVNLSEDGCTAEGQWWYTRVGLQADIPPQFHGGSYFFKRLHSTDTDHPQP